MQNKEKPKNKMTEKEAVRMACEMYAPGQLVSASQMYRDTVRILQIAGYPHTPLQSTVSRRYREIKEQVGMEYVPKLKLYMKAKQVRLSAEEKLMNQQVLF